MSQPNLQWWGTPSRANPGPHYLSGTSGGKKAPPRTFPTPPQDLGRRRLQDYVPFAKGSGQARGLSPMWLREQESEKRHGVHFGVGPPHSPKLKVMVPILSSPHSQPAL